MMAKNPSIGKLYKWSVMKRLIGIGALLGLIGVIAGALGAHQLERISPTFDLKDYYLANTYHMLHALAMVVSAILWRYTGERTAKWASYFFGLGIILFSFSIYFLVYGQVTETNTFRIIGPITPVGGICLMIGWVLLAIPAIRSFFSK